MERRRRWSTPRTDPFIYRKKVAWPADSIILATARASEATLWTQDDDFEGLDDVKYIAKKKGAK